MVMMVRMTVIMIMIGKQKNSEDMNYNIINNNDEMIITKAMILITVFIMKMTMIQRLI